MQGLEDHIPGLRRYARALVLGQDRADDLVQDALERAWAHRGKWQPGSNLRAWLFTILHNVWANDVRRWQSRPPELSLQAEHLSARTVVEDHGALLDLEHALALLSPERREVLLLAGVEQMAYEEIAAILGVPMGTVMSRLARARRDLRDILNGNDHKPVLTRIK